MTVRAKRQILVVDDEPGITRMLQFLFEHHGFEVKRAHSTAQGMSMLAAEIPDLVVLDFMMPHLTGVELCRFIRRDPRTSHVPVIVYSAVSNDENIQAAMEAGATRFLEKTVDQDVLLKAIIETLTPSSS